MGILRWIPGALLLVPWLLGPVAPSLDVRIRDLSGSASFRLLDWESVHLGERATRLWSGLVGPTNDPSGLDIDLVQGYFRTPLAQRANLRSQAEPAVERVVARAYADAGLARGGPLPWDRRLFPPVLVAFTPPPNVLVVAPRTEMRVIESSVVQALDETAQERLEASADSTGVSSLVAPIGGLATYPSMVLEEESAVRTLVSVAHEWLHQYLIFYPLGARYWSSQETREINETTADLVSQEIGRQVARTLSLPNSAAASGTSRASQPIEFNFRAFMRETRASSEQLLKRGDVEAAEAYMRARRDQLELHGYKIRKLNQAYFALYGSYGDGFAASPANPIPDLLRALREHSGSLGDFILRVREITTVDELRRAAS